MENHHETTGHVHVEELTENLKDRVRDAAHTAGECLREAKDVAREVVNEYTGWAKEKGSSFHSCAKETTVEDVEERVTGFVRENPGKALVVAAGAGAVIGFMIRGIGRSR